MRLFLTTLLLLAGLVSSSLQAQERNLPIAAGSTGRDVPIVASSATGARFIIVDAAFTDARFSFSLDTSSVVSIWVQRSVDSVLVREIVKAKRYAAGSYTEYWDGLDNDGQAVAPGSYFIGGLGHNVRYTWEGVAGNSSFVLGNTDQSHRGYQFIRQMVEAGDYAYFNRYYTEGAGPVEKFRKTAPQVSISIYPRGFGSGTGSEHLCTDGSRVYFTRYDQLRQDHKNRTWISALSVSNDAAYSFTGGSSYTPKEAPNFPESVAGLIVSDSASNHTTGIGVQRSGNTLLVSYAGKNQIRLFNKLTGAQTGTITSLSSPRQIAVDASDNIWIVSGTNTVARYTLSGSTLSSPSLTLSGLTTPMSVAVSSDGATVYVGEGSTQQVRIYNASTGAAQTTLGQSGGYASTATVADDRFYFSDLSGGINFASVCPISDGSFWVTDLGNYRVQHFSSSRTFIERIAYISASYTSTVDAADPTRVFDQYLEYSVDYSKPLSSGVTLVRNWRNQSPGVYFRLDNVRQNVDMFGVFTGVLTMNNGRTYGWLKKYDSNYQQVLAELVPGGVLRPIPALTFTIPVYLRPDGSLNYTERSGATIVWKRRALSGFDASNNPVWASAVTEGSAPVTALDAVDPTGFGDTRAGQRTASGKMVMYQHELTRNVNGVIYGLGYHLAAIKAGGTNWLWKTERAVNSPSYRGEYPTDGAYDAGNHDKFRTGQQTGFGGGAVTVTGNHVFTNYFGEFWKDSQTNKWHHRTDGGILLNVWGPTSLDVPGSRNIPGMAGGVHWGTAVTVGSDIFLYHAEEGGYSGLHRWKISNLSSIKRLTVLAVTSTASRRFLPKPVTDTDLLAGLPRVDTLDAPGTAGWSFTGSVDTTAEFGGSFWALKTGARSYDRFVSPDLWMQFRKVNQTYTVTRSLPVTSALPTWSLAGVLNLANSWGNDGNIGDAVSNGWYADVLDNAGKIILRIYNRRDGNVSPTQAYLYANSNVLIQSNEFGGALGGLTSNHPVSLSRTGSGLQVSWAGFSATNLAVFESGADAGRPTNLRFTFWNKNASVSRDLFVNIQSLRFTTP